MLKHTRPYLTLVLALFLSLAFAGPVPAATDPTLHQVYQAVQTGHLDQAQQMMNQVLRDHPRSARAHYVAAELYAKAHNLPLARQELNTAQALEPGLPFANPRSVQALQTELSQARPVHALPGYSQSFPWGPVVFVVAGVGVLWLVLRRRRSPGGFYPAYPGQYPPGQYPGGVPTAPGAPGNPGGVGVAPSVGPGIGSGIAGGLASGLAVGAGVVAGEELAHHFLDSGRHEGSAPPAANEPVDNPENNDPGGQDFGVSDGGSWDDDPSGLGGSDGGDDWT
jgi:hypothetical protein